MMRQGEGMAKMQLRKAALVGTIGVAGALFLVTSLSGPGSLTKQAQRMGLTPKQMGQVVGSAEFPLAPGVYDQLLVQDGVIRQYILKIPETYDGTVPIQVILVFHGGNQNAEQYFDKRSKLRELADEREFAIAFMQARTSTSYGDGNWNAVHCCRTAKQEDYDDLGYTAAVVDELVAELNIDLDRIYVSGFSNGAMMTHKVAANMPDVFAAAAMMSGPIGGVPKTNSAMEYLSASAGPLGVLTMHGKLDTKIYYDGGPSTDSNYGRTDISAPDGVDFWATQMGCEDSPTTTDLMSDAHLNSWTDCAEGVQVRMITLDNVAHAWPTLDSHGFDGDTVVANFLLNQTNTAARISDWASTSWGPPVIPD